MKKVIIMMLSLMPSLIFAATVSVFVSFSMPHSLLIGTLKDANRCQILAYLNGLHHGSMSETASKVMALAKEVPDLNLQIDPTAFERFGIQQVPALVVAEGESSDVIYGHLSLKEGLLRMANRGDTHLSIQKIRSICGE